jgi:heme A synthase
MAVRLLRYERDHPLRALGTLLLAVVFAQVLLGGYVIWSAKQPHITSLHVMTGAFTLALSVVLTLSARTLGWAKSQLPVAGSRLSETSPPTANRQPSTVHREVPV